MNTDLSQIPALLKPRRQWVTWRHETREGKATKVNYDPMTGKMAKVNDPTTWASYDDAVAVLDSYEGLGFALTPEDSFTGVDLDRCVDPSTGRIDPWALTLVDQLYTYTELSPSGEGLRLFCQGDLPPGWRKLGVPRPDRLETAQSEGKQPALELYDQKHFLSVTGHHLAGTPRTIEDRHATLQRVHAAHVKQNGHSQKAALVTVRSDHHETDGQLIERMFAAKNGSAIRALWSGDIDGYASHSEADAALCHHLAFWCQRDEGRMDQLFRQSGLMREKWNTRYGTSTYGAHEIARACSRVTETATLSIHSPTVTHDEIVPCEAPEVDLPPFPPSAYLGVANDIASLYAEFLEAPKEFFYIDCLTFLGTCLATSVRLDSVLQDEPRLYTVKVARSGTDRKSSSQDVMEHFFADLLESRGIKLCYGAGSAEGLQRIMKDSPATLLIYDEMRAFVDKASVQQSVLLPMVSTLFHRTKYENSTKHSEIKLTDAHLSVVAACTKDTFLTMFSPQFRNIGFLNRLFVVTGQRSTRHPIPSPIPLTRLTPLKERVRRIVEQAGREHPILTFEAEAKARWSEWYLALPDSPYAIRLDTYGLRFLMLMAVSTETWQITRELVDAVIALMDYQLTVRKELDPVDAEGVVARMERTLLRHLAKGRMPESRLQKLANVKHYGLWVYEGALKNVMRQGWVEGEKVRKGRHLWLTTEGRHALSE